jgi:hypothetical protein
MPSRNGRDDATPGRISGRDSFAAVRMTGASPPLGRWIGLAVVLLGVAIVKPWGSDGASPASPATASRALALAGWASVSVVATPVVDTASAERAVESICFNPLSWRVATVERWRDQTIRVWRAIEPRAVASGPEDGRVPITPLVSEGVIELGWCAPVDDSVRMAGSAVVEVWRRTPTGAQPVTMSSQRPGPATSPYGALYGAPSAPVVTLWNDGTYVFHQRAPNGEESWFGVEVERRPSTGTRG